MEWLLVKWACRGAAGMGSRRRLFFAALVILVCAGGRSRRWSRLICAGWLPQDGAVRLELSACLESSVIHRLDCS